MSKNRNLCHNLKIVYGVLRLNHNPAFLFASDFHDSGIFSIPSSCPSRSITPLHRFELGALKGAFNVPEQLNEHEDTPVARPKTPKTPTSPEVCFETDPKEADWDFSLPKITPRSRTALKILNEIFLPSNENRPVLKNKFTPERRKELALRFYYHR